MGWQGPSETVVADLDAETWRRGREAHKHTELVNRVDALEAQYRQLRGLYDQMVNIVTRTEEERDSERLRADHERAMRVKAEDQIAMLTLRH